MYYARFLFLTLLTGCSFLVPDYERPSAPMADSWNHQADLQTAQQDFWQSFDDAQLAALLKQAVAGNQNLQAGLARVDEANAQVDVASAGLFPQLSASAVASRTRTHTPGGATASHNTLSVGPDLSYQLDLWGRYRDTADAADFRAKATAFDQKTLTLMTLSSVGTGYVDYLTLSERLALAQDNAANLADVMRIIDARYKAGAASGLDQAQQQIEVQNQTATVAALVQQRDAALTSLAVLTGQSPSAMKLAAPKLADIHTPSVRLSKPQDLLAQRPDILSAEANLKAANIDIGAARAAFFPSINLAADGSLLATSFAGPIGTAASIGAGLAAPLFTGGELTGNLNFAEARKKELVADYRQTVLVAQQEVEDALAAYTSAQQQEAALAAAHEAANKAYGIARARYDVGSSAYVDLLEAQRSLFQATDAEAAAKGAVLIAAIDLYQALGGTR